MKSLIWVFLTTLTCSFAQSAETPPPSWQQAENYFSQKLYDQALPLFLQVEKEGPTSFKTRAQIRGLECELFAGKIPQALEHAWAAEPGRPDTAEKALLGLLRMQIAHSFLGSHQRSAKEIKSKSNSLEDLSKENWEEKIRETFLSLWKNQDRWGQVSIESLSNVLQEEGTTPGFTPTLWTFLVDQASDVWPESNETLDLKKATDLALQPELKKDLGAWNTISSTELFSTLWSEIENTDSLPPDARDWARWKRAARLIPSLASGTDATLEERKKAARALTEIAEGIASPLLNTRASLEVAQLWESLQNLSEVVRICQRVEKSGQRESNNCFHLRARIESPELEIQGLKLVPQKTQKLNARSRNIPTLHWQLLSTSMEELKALNAGYRSEGYRFLRYPDSEMLRNILRKKPLHQGSISPTAPEKYAFANTALTLPALESGVYVLVVANHPTFKTGKDLIQATLLTVSSRALVASLSGTQGTAKLFLYPWDSSQSTPASTGQIEVFERADQATKHRILNLADADFQLEKLSQGVELSPSTQWNTDALYQDAKDLAALDQPLYLRAPTPSPIELFLEIDRRAYRPGQRLLGKVVSLDRKGDDYLLPKTGRRIQLTIRDSQGQKWKTLEVTTGVGAAASFDLVIPQNKLLGTYSIEASTSKNGQTYRADSSFSVVAYRRPEAEITFTPIDTAILFNTPATLRGNVKYYSSQSISGARVEWKLYHLPHLLGRSKWSIHAPQKQLIQSGEARSSSQGAFEIAFTLKNENKELDAQNYQLEANLISSNGSLSTQTLSFTASKTPYRLSLNQPELFYSTQGGALSLQASTPGGVSTLFEGTLQFELLGKPASKEPENCDRFRPWSQAFAGTEPNEKWEMSVMKSFPLTLRGTAQIQLPLLEPGIYRLSAVSKNSSEKLSVGFIPVVDISENTEKKTIRGAPLFGSRDKAQYQVGQTAKVLLGSSATPKNPNTKAVLELWSAEKLLSTQWVDGTLLTHAISIPAGAEGGVTARWIQVQQNCQLVSEVFLPVPRASKEIALSAELPESQAPGTRASLVLSAKAKKKTALYGTVRAVDSALDALHPPQDHWLTTLYRDRTGIGASSGSSAIPYAVSLSNAPWEYPAIPDSETPALKLPGFHWRGQSHGLGGGIQLYAMAPRASSKIQSMESAVAVGNAAPSESETPIRSDFRETALFLRDLQMEASKEAPKKQVSVPLADSLTRWNISTYVYDSELRIGKQQNQILATKPLTVRIASSRIFRERDKAWISVAVNNDSNLPSPLKGSLQVKTDFMSMEGVSKSLPERKFDLSLPKKATQTFSWFLSLPNETGVLKFTATASAAKLRDGETREISVLPSKIRTVQSTVAKLPEKAGETLKLSPKLKPNAEALSTTLGMFPLDMLTVAQALPALQLSETARTDQIAYELVPLAVMQNLFQRFPEIQKRLAQMPASKTLWSKWKSEDERRFAHLESSPWLAEAAGGKEEGRWLARLTSSELKDLFDGHLKRLESLQLVSGAWPWFQGGKEDRTITLLILGMLSQVQKFKDISKSPLVTSALGYLQGMVREKDLDLVTRLQAASLFTAFQVHNPTIDTWMQAQWKSWESLEQPLKELSPLQRAQVAQVGFFLKKPEANLWMERVFEGSTDDALAGLSWPQDLDHWHSHRDSAFQQASLLLGLLEFAPSEPRIEKLAQSLLWNRYSHQWKSPRAASFSVAALARWLSKKPFGFASPNWTAHWATEQKTLDLSTTKRKRSLSEELLWTKTGPAQNKPVEIQVKKPAPGFASLTSLLLLSQAEAESSEAVSLRRRFFKVILKDGKTRHEELEQSDSISVGTEVMVEFEFKTKGSVEYLQLQNPRGSGFEPSQSDSSWTYENGLPLYLEVQDPAENLFIPRLDSGRTRVYAYWRAALPGTYAIAPATVQSLLAPAVSAHSGSYELKIAQPPKLDQERKASKSH